jgi:ketosteroid isomerase-like protein
MPEMGALQSWLDAYVEAWRTYDPKQIGALFSQDAVYAWHPYNDTPARGREAIVNAWLEKPDDPADWECRYQALAVTGDVGVASGWTRYRPNADKPAREYKNLFVIRFDAEGRCREFTEWYVEPEPKADA